jgi:hypothetical protein
MIVVLYGLSERSNSLVCLEEGLTVHQMILLPQYVHLSPSFHQLVFQIIVLGRLITRLIGNVCVDELRLRIVVPHFSNHFLVL